MKKVFLYLFINTVISLSLLAQETTLKESKNRIGFEPFRLISKSLGLNYERDINSSLSLKFFSQIVNEVEYHSYAKGFVEDFGVKIFGIKEKDVFGVGLSAFFLPYLHFSTFDIKSYRRYYRPFDGDYTEREFPRKFIGYGGGFLIGFGTTFFEKVCFDFYIGGGVQSNNLVYKPYFNHTYDDDFYYSSSTPWEKKGILARGGFEISFKL